MKTEIFAPMVAPDMKFWSFSLTSQDRSHILRSGIHVVHRLTCKTQEVDDQFSYSCDGFWLPAIILDGRRRKTIFEMKISLFWQSGCGERVIHLIISVLRVIDNRSRSKVRVYKAKTLLRLKTNGDHARSASAPAYVIKIPLSTPETLPFQSIHHSTIVLDDRRAENRFWKAFSMQKAVLCLPVYQPRFRSSSDWSFTNSPDGNIKWPNN